MGTTFFPNCKSLKLTASLVRSDWRASNPPPTHTILLNASNQNFEIAIFFNVVERSENYVFEDDTPLPPRTLSARVISYVLGAYKVCTEKVIV
jgi:hypothetical protein